MPVEIDRDELRRLVAGGAQLVEVLPRDEYEEDHLPEAVSMPLRRIDRDAVSLLDPGRAVVVYCWDTT